MNIVWLREVSGTDRAEVGGKAANIATLQAMGIPTPDGFVVSVDAFASYLRTNGLWEAVQALSSPRMSGSEMSAALAHIRTQIEGGRWPLGVRNEIAAAYEELSDSVAVRSSGIVEDGDKSSFAGAFSSFLFREGASAVLDAVQLCWASAFTERVLAYRLDGSREGAGWLMGVIVQKMIVARRAGVLFTRNPFSQSDTMLLEAVAGGCDEIVSGRPADVSVEIDRRTKAAVHTDGRISASSRFGTGTHAMLAAPAPRSVSLLSFNEVQSLAEVGLEIEKAFGMPQDIEWGIADEGLVVLQSRPLTAYKYPSH